MNDRDVGQAGQLGLASQVGNRNRQAKDGQAKHGQPRSPCSPSGCVRGCKTWLINAAVKAWLLPAWFTLGSFTLRRFTLRRFTARRYCSDAIVASDPKAFPCVALKSEAWDADRP